MEANKILTSDLLDLVFEGRNKDYGAYDLRRTYNRRLWIAIGIAMGIAILALAWNYISGQVIKKSDKVAIKEVVMQDLKEEKEEKKPEPPPPPPKQPEPPKVEMKAFTPPVIKKDEEVQEPPPAQEELKDVKIDVKTQEGIKDEGIAAPAVIDEGKGVVVEQKKVEEDENKIFEKVEIEAEFPGGQGAWKKYLERNLQGNVPIDNEAPPGVYKVEVQFVVDKAGNISDVKALTNHGYGMEQEAVRVIKKGPGWTPAQQNGRNVTAYRRQPVTFQVQGE